MPGVLREPASRVRIASPVMRIGRSPDSDIAVSDLGVSKQHAELRRSPAGRYSITDLGSHNGRYVNGTRVSRQELSEGDIIAIGDTAFRLAGGELTEYPGGGADGELLAATRWAAYFVGLDGVRRFGAGPGRLAGPTGFCGRPAVR